MSSSPATTTTIFADPDLQLTRTANIFTITMSRAPENRLTKAYCQRLIATFHQIHALLLGSSSSSSSGSGSGSGSGGEGVEGAVITRGGGAKFWCTGLELEESDTDPFANSDGFYPLLATIVDFPFPTVALVSGHCFGGGCPFALAHDYRVMNSERGFFSMPPVNLGLHFPGIGTLPRLKLQPQVARRMLLEAHRWTGKQALEDGIVDAVAPPDQMLDVAMEIARKWQGKAKMEVYSLLRNELYGEAGRQFREISYVHGRRNDRPAKAKI